MNLKDDFQGELTRLGSGGPFVVTARDQDRRIRCELQKADSIACSFTRLTLETKALSDASISQLQRISQALADRLTYLLEPIDPIESDHLGCTIQMRSVPPQKEDDAASYYELLVRRGGELTLCRYEKAPGQGRQPISTDVTKEVLIRLVSDLDAAIEVTIA